MSWRSTDYESEGRRFASCWAHQYLSEVSPTRVPVLRRVVPVRHVYMVPEARELVEAMKRARDQEVQKSAIH